MAESQATQPAPAKRLPLPDVGDFIFLLLLQVPLFLRPNFVFGDGSTGWHLVTGDWILLNHAVPNHDLISYTMPNQPWVAYEWLSDVVMALAVRAGGLNLLAVLVSCSVALLTLLIYDRCRKEGCHFALATCLTMLACFLTAIHWLARPILFLFFGVYIFSTKLEDFHRGTVSGTKLILFLTLTMLIWVNTHPSWVLGIVFLAIYLVSNLVTWAAAPLPELRKEAFSKIRWLILASLLSIGASFVNPYGLRLHEYIYSYFSMYQLHGNQIQEHSNEFASPVFHYAFQPFCLEILFALLIIGLAIGAKRLAMPRLLCCVAFSHLALSAVRNMPLFGIVVTPAIAQLFARLQLFPGIEQESSPTRWRQLLGNASAKLRQLSDNFDEQEALCKMHLLPIAAFVFLVIVAVNGGKAFGTQILNSGWDPESKPTAILDVLSQYEQKGLSPTTGFNMDNWGGLIRYKLGAERGRVFIDDRANVYGDPFYLEYGRVCEGSSGWQDVLRKYKIDWVLFPKDSRLCANLHDDPNWQLAGEDQASCLYIRKAKFEALKLAH